MNAPDRRTYIGGGAIAAVINESPYQTALQLWQAMTSEGPPLPLAPEQEKFFRRRRQAEPIIVQMLREDYGIEATKVSFAVENRYWDPDVPFFGAEIDYETVMTRYLAERFPTLASVPIGEIVNGEIKAMNAHSIKAWGDPEREEVPRHIAAQAHWGLGVTRRRACLVSPLFGIDSLPIFPILYNKPVTDWLRSEARIFLGLVATGTPPPPKERDLVDLKRWAKLIDGTPVELDAASIKAAVRIFDLRRRAKTIEKGIDDQEFRLFDYIRRAWKLPADPTVGFRTDNAVLRYQGEPIAVWSRRVKEDLDVKRLRAEDPMAYHRFKRQTVYRTLTKPPKGTR